MNFENDQWNRADLEFSHWMKGKKSEVNPDHTNILKSTYFVFREKEHERLKSLCNKAFEIFKKKENNRFDESIGFIQEYKSVFEDDILLENVPMFSKISTRDEPISKEKSTKRDNDNIIHGILSGDQQTFDDLYEYGFPKIVRLVTKNSGTLDEAKDIFQDALVVLIEKAYRKEFDLTSTIGTYLYSICRNLWLEQLRKGKNFISLNDSFSHLDATITFIIDETIPDTFEDVSKAIESLGDPCRKLLEYYYYENLSWVEIASSLGYSSAASARNQKYKCLERIRNSVCG